MRTVIVASPPAAVSRAARASVQRASASGAVPTPSVIESPTATTACTGRGASTSTPLSSSHDVIGVSSAAPRGASHDVCSATGCSLTTSGSAGTAIVTANGPEPATGTGSLTASAPGGITVAGPPAERHRLLGPVPDPAAPAPRPDRPRAFVRPRSHRASACRRGADTASPGRPPARTVLRPRRHCARAARAGRRHRVDRQRRRPVHVGEPHPHLRAVDLRPHHHPQRPAARHRPRRRARLQAACHAVTQLGPHPAPAAARANPPSPATRPASRPARRRPPPPQRPPKAVGRGRAGTRVNGTTGRSGSVTMSRTSDSDAGEPPNG